MQCMVPGPGSRVPGSSGPEVPTPGHPGTVYSSSYSADVVAGSREHSCSSGVTGAVSVECVVAENTVEQ